MSRLTRRATMFGGLLWRLRSGTAGVKPVDDLVREDA